MTRRRQALAYFLLGVALWFVVDWGTAGGFRPSYFAAYIPALLVFYLGCPAVFTYLVFRQRDPSTPFVDSRLGARRVETARGTSPEK